MSTLRHHRELIRLTTAKARKRDSFQQRIILRLLILLRIPRPLHARNSASRDFLSLRSNLPIAVQFPSLFVVFARVQEFAGIAEAAEAGLFVVFADVRGEVDEGDGAQVRGGFDGADVFTGEGVRVCGYEVGVGGLAFVRPIRLGIACGCRGRRFVPPAPEELRRTKSV